MHDCDGLSFLWPSPRTLMTRISFCYPLQNTHDVTNKMTNKQTTIPLIKLATITLKSEFTFFAYTTSYIFSLWQIILAPWQREEKGICPTCYVDQEFVRERPRDQRRRWRWRDIGRQGRGVPQPSGEDGVGGRQNIQDIKSLQDVAEIVVDDDPEAVEKETSGADIWRETLRSLTLRDQSTRIEVQICTLPIETGQLQQPWFISYTIKPTPHWLQAERCLAIWG